MSEAAEIAGDLDCEDLGPTDGEMVGPTLGCELTTTLGIIVGRIDLYGVEELNPEGDRQVPEALNGC